MEVRGARCFVQQAVPTSGITLERIKIVDLANADGVIRRYTWIAVRGFD
jgi:hypothetical protein